MTTAVGREFEALMLLLMPTEWGLNVIDSFNGVIAKWLARAEADEGKRLWTT